MKSIGVHHPLQSLYSKLQKHGIYRYRTHHSSCYYLFFKFDVQALKSLLATNICKSRQTQILSQWTRRKQMNYCLLFLLASHHEEIKETFIFVHKSEIPMYVGISKAQIWFCCNLGLVKKTYASVPKWQFSCSDMLSVKWSICTIPASHLVVYLPIKSRAVNSQWNF